MTSGGSNDFPQPDITLPGVIVCINTVMLAINISSALYIFLIFLCCLKIQCLTFS